MTEISALFRVYDFFGFFFSENLNKMKIDCLIRWQLVLRRLVLIIHGQIFFRWLKKISQKNIQKKPKNRKKIGDIFLPFHGFADLPTSKFLVYHFLSCFFNKNWHYFQRKKKCICVGLFCRFRNNNQTYAKHFSHQCLILVWLAKNIL